MAAYGINAGDVAAAIRNQNLDVPAGRLGQPPVPAGQPWELPIDALGRLSDAGAIRRHHRQGRPGDSGFQLDRQCGRASTGMPGPGLSNPPKERISRRIAEYAYGLSATLANSFTPSTSDSTGGTTTSAFSRA